MHFYDFNINDFNASTRHLSHLERALYRDLIDMYYSNEKPITTDLAKLERQLIVKSDDEKQALQNVLADFFVVKKLKGDVEPCYHNARIDQRLKNYKHRQNLSNKSTNTTNASTSQLQTVQTQVQTTTNASTNSSTNKNSTDNKKSFLIESLKNQGVKANTRMRISELQTLFDTHCKPTTNATTNGTNASTNTTNEVQTPFCQSITNNQEPITNNHKPSNISPQTPQGGGECDSTTLEQTDETTKIHSTKTQTASKADKPLNVPFGEFWDLYDKKIDPKKCETIWKKLSDKDRLDAMAYIPKYVQSQPDKQFRKNPQTFLNARSWESEIIDTKASGKKDPLAVNDAWRDFVPPPTPTEQELKAFLEQGWVQASKPMMEI